KNRTTKKFIDNSIGPETWFWEFGDGTTSTQQNPLHTYSTPGFYVVKLTVTNGSCSHSTTRNVVMMNEKANFQTADTILCRNSMATFTAFGMKRGNISSWQWNFGDGASGTQDSIATHVYTAAGNYKVTL